MQKLTGGLQSSLQQGNRSSSSACGSADVLEALGVIIDLHPEVSLTCGSRSFAAKFVVLDCFAVFLV